MFNPIMERNKELDKILGEWTIILEENEKVIWEIKTLINRER